jgi:hypothetical protein
MKRINRARVAAVRMCYSQIYKDEQALYVYKKLTELAAGPDNLNGYITDFPVWYRLEGMPADALLLSIDAAVDDILRLFPKKEKPAVASETAEIVEMVGQRAALPEASPVTTELLAQPQPKVLNLGALADGVAASARNIRGYLVPEHELTSMQLSLRFPDGHPRFVKELWQSRSMSLPAVTYWEWVQTKVWDAQP